MVSARAGFWGKTFALTRKDLRTETRARDTLPPMLAFSLAVTVLLAFTLPGSARLTSPITTPAGTVALGQVLAGFLWVTILFSGLIGFARTFEIEHRGGALDALLLAPLDRSGIFVAKAVSNLAYIAAVEVLLFPVFGVFFGLDLGRGWWALLAVAALTDVAFAAAGTLFASLAAQTRSRELILPLLALPALVPVFIGATELTTDLFLGETLSDVAARGWFGILIAGDVLFSVAGALAFDFVLD